MELAPLLLKKNEERRLRQGHLWVYSNEVNVERTPLTAFTPGQPVQIIASDGKALGTGYVNPHSLICARLVSRDPAQRLDRSLLVHRLNVALALRERLYAEPYYRLVYGEGDLLPGLVVDRFGDVLVAQITTAGMEVLKEDVVAALDKVVKPRAILLRNDSAARAPEGLDSYVATALGEAPDRVAVVENGVRYEAPLLTGQKTGWFYDHRDNRARMQRYVRGGRVLDVFSYIGGWGIAAAVAGAAQVTCVDASGPALDQVRRNAELNGVADRVDAIEGDAFEALKALRADKARYDVVIVDPPAFIKRKKDAKEGIQAYRRINQAALQLLGKDGILVAASCSFHLQREVFLDLLHQSARHLDRQLQILEQGHQGPDHPLHPAIPETEYIKCFTARSVML
ncbi:class I SAM-dependent rRNA methyltransferase [Sulfurivermis fontis]|uniref:class I SAM-dependent rRNA methyltransferase n=1 Tax=Sulfurivermis fontis TaxID=1972068 RepID=UPI000FD9C0EA|nr:class I SAM-dependent rRNA methyltransferase [Sulfurivermis fontis]